MPSRREFARLFTAGGSAALFLHPAFADKTKPFVPSPVVNEGFWKTVREQFLMPPGIAVLNAANLCPAPAPVLEAMYKTTRELDREPSSSYRAGLLDVKEATRRKLADFLRASPDEIVITRNTSESNNLVSSGLDLKAGDEVVVFSDNHPSNKTAWQEKGKRFGYSVRTIDIVNPHPGADYYLEAAARQLGPRTKVLAFSHLTNTVGDLFPARELCRLAREREVLTLIDGAQSFGLLDVDLSDIQPDFYTGSAHKWPCGPKEAGVLYINKRSHSKIWPSIYSAFPGATGISKSFECFGQRDDGAMAAFGAAIDFQVKVGRKNIEDRARQIGQAFVQELGKIRGVKLWTHADPQRTGPVVTFRPGELKSEKLAQVLFEKEGVICAVRGGSDRPGIRFSPHFYNSHREVERVAAAIRRYMASGL
jgi:isopenicillin-N epimerase